VVRRSAVGSVCPHLVEKARCSNDDYYTRCKPTPKSSVKFTPVASDAYYKSSPAGYKKAQRVYKYKPSPSSSRRYVVKGTPSADSYTTGYHVSYRPAVASDSYLPAASYKPVARVASSDSYLPAASYKPTPSSDAYGKRK